MLVVTQLTIEGTGNVIPEPILLTRNEAASEKSPKRKKN